MSNLARRWQALAPQLLSVLRIVAALMFLQSGTMKFFDWPMAMPGGGPPPVMSQVWIGGMLELVGGFLLMIGLFTRPVAFVLSGEMAVAYFQFHFPQGFWPIVNQGQPAVLYCFLWLYLSAAGAGPWSVDALRSGRRGRG
ncbi:MAG TPA: DoxX family protein [Thermoanaerobaculia bacterium]